MVEVARVYLGIWSSMEEVARDYLGTWSSMVEVAREYPSRLALPTSLSLSVYSSTSSC